MFCDGHPNKSLPVDAGADTRSWARQALQSIASADDIDRARSFLLAQLSHQPDDLELLNEYIVSLTLAGSFEGREILWVEALETVG